MVFDLSTSIGPNGLEKTQEAGKAVVEALKDAEVEIGIYNFGSKAPSTFAEGATTGGPMPIGSAEELTNVIDQLALPPSGTEGTNWDRGLGQIPLGTYDVVYFITDGLPTAFGDAKSDGRGEFNRPAWNHGHNGKANKDYAAARSDVQRAVQSANALKTSGTRIVPLAVGNEVNSGQVATTYLGYISGEADWIKVDDYSKLSDDLLTAATEGCRGEVTLVKQLTDADGNITDNAVGGYSFEAAAIPEQFEKFHLNNTDAVTNEGGTASFSYIAPNNAARGSFTIQETGNTPKEVICASDDGTTFTQNSNPFTVPARAGGNVKCTVNNPAPVTVTVTETTTEAPSTVTETTTAEPITTTVTEIPEVVTTVETETVTETPEPSTVEKTVTQTPDSVTVTETPDTVTVTEVPNPATETVTETPDVETETVTVTTTETQEPTPTTVTQTTTQTETSTATQTETTTATATATQTETETATATETAKETETQTDTTTATTTATDTQVVTTTETTTVTGEPVTEVQTVTPAPVTETVTAEVTVVNEVPGEQVTVTNTSTVTETVDNTVEKTVEKTINNTVTETVDNTIEKTVDNVITSVIQGEPVTVTNNATVTETQTETTTVVSDREPSAATATVTVTATETQVVTTTVGAGAGDAGAGDAGAGNAGAKETVVVTTTAGLFSGSSDGDIRGGSSIGREGGSSADGIVDDRCIPAVIGLGIPLLATIPLSLLQQVSIPGLDAYSAEINSRITQANNQIQQQLGIFDENTARMVQEFNAQVNRIGAENQQILQWAGIAAAIVGIASYLFYFCVPRPDAEQGSSN